MILMYGGISLSDEVEILKHIKNKTQKTLFSHIVAILKDKETTTCGSVQFFWMLRYSMHTRGNLDQPSLGSHMSGENSLH